jgi:hypothetical protein
MKLYNIYNNGHASKINMMENGKSFCKNLDISDLKKYIRKEATLQEIGDKYFA